MKYAASAAKPPIKSISSPAKNQYFEVKTLRSDPIRNKAKKVKMIDIKKLELLAKNKNGSSGKIRR